MKRKEKSYWTLFAACYTFLYKKEMIFIVFERACSPNYTSKACMFGLRDNDQLHSFYWYISAKQARSSQKGAFSL